MHFLIIILLIVVLMQSALPGTGVEHQGHPALRVKRREQPNTLPQIQTEKTSTFGLNFQKCAQIDTGSKVPQVKIYLVVRNPSEGTDLSQLGIRDAVSGITLLQTSGSIWETGYQTFYTDSLPAGSTYEVTYTASIKGSKNEILSLPAFLTFSSSSQNDIFGPVVANFTLRLNTTEKVSVNHALHFAGFCGGFFVSTLLFSFTLLSASGILNKCRKRYPQRKRRQGLSGGVDTEEAVCNISEWANEEAAFEDKFIDIIALEDTSNLLKALDNVEHSAVLRGALAVECVRVQMIRGLFGVLLGGLGAAGQRVLTVLLGQVTGMEGKLQEEQAARLATLNAHFTMETQQEMEAQHHTHTAQKTYTERVLQQSEQQEVLEVMVLLEKLQKLEQEDVRRVLLAKHERASGEVRRHTALCRRTELHSIFSEELQEASRTGELDQDISTQLLHLYYTSQDRLEEVLDLFVANQRAVMSERRAQRRFLLQGLKDLQGALWDTLSTSSQQIDGWFSQIHREGGLSAQACVEHLERAQLELHRIRQTVEEKLNNQRSAALCDLMKRRRARISEIMCEQKREQQELGNVCEGPVDQYLSQWQMLLSAHSTHFLELITHLDREAVAEIRKVLLRVLQEAALELKALGAAVSQSLQALGVPRWLLQKEVGGEAVAEAKERLHVQAREVAMTLQARRKSIQLCRLQELQRQRHLRERLALYCRNVCAPQRSLSEADLLRVRLEYVKCVCRLDRCLELLLSQAGQYPTTTDPTGHCTQLDPNTNCHDPSVTLKEMKCHPEVFLRKGLNSEVCTGDTDVQSFRKRLEERVQLLQQDREKENLAGEQVCTCEDVEQEVYMCEQSMVMALVALQWERAERRSRVLETHSTLLTLQTLLLQHLQHTHNTQELSHTIHAHSLALEEAELQLQKEESEWEELVCGRGSAKALADDEELFCVDKECRMVTDLQKALCKRQELSHALTEKLREVGRRQQMMEDLRDQLELKHLYTLCDQDLVLSAVLVKFSGVSVKILQELLRLLLPTVPEGELQSLTDALGPKAGRTPARCSELLDRLRSDIIYENLPPSPSLTGREIDRLLKKKQNLLQKLFPSSAVKPKGRLKVSEQEHDQRLAQRPVRQPVSPSAHAKQESVIGPRPVEGAGEQKVWVTDSSSGDEVGMAIESPVSGEKLFVFRSPPANQKHTPHTLHTSVQSRRKKRSFLSFKKGTVVPEEQT